MASSHEFVLDDSEIGERTVVKTPQLSAEAATPVNPRAEEAAADLAQQAAAEKYDQILEMIENPNCSVASISRLISVEIAKTSKVSALFVANKVADATLVWKSKVLADHIKSLRELSKQLTETEVLSKKDMLNMDGPKFLFVLKEIAKLYKQALKDAGCEPSLVENAMKHFADLIRVNDARLRREVDQMDSGK